MSTPPPTWWFIEPSEVENMLDMFFNSRTQDPCLAEDLRQTVMARVQAGIQKKVEGGEIGSAVDMRRWIFGIAKNVRREEQRRSRRWFRGREHASAMHGESQKSAEEALISQSRAKSRAERFQELLNKLPEHQAAVLRFRYLHEFNDAEIAQVLGISINTVRSRAHRAKRKLEKMAKKEFADG